MTDPQAPDAQDAEILFPGGIKMRLPRLLLLTTLFLLLTSFAMADTTITITFTGDITLGGEDRTANEPTSFASVYKEKGPDYFLANFKDFFAEDDLTVANLEGVLANEGQKSREKKNYFFRGDTEYVSILKNASIDAVSLANNHIGDYGEFGLNETIRTLDDAGIQWFGTRNYNRTPSEKFLFYEKDGVTICLMSLYWTDYFNADNTSAHGYFLSQEIQRIKAEGEADAIIAILHGGQEYGRHRTKPQNTFTEMAMEAGADLVICHHAHVVMGMDVINNRSAFYSLGNFCFGGNKFAYQTVNKQVRDAAPALIVRAELTFDDEGKYKGQQMTVYPIQTTSVDRVGTSNQPNDYQPKFITGPLAAHALHLLQYDTNWDLSTRKHRIGDPVNQALRDFIINKENELAAMESSEGMACLVLPYLPAEE